MFCVSSSAAIFPIVFAVVIADSGSFHALSSLHGCRSIIVKASSSGFQSLSSLVLLLGSQLLASTSVLVLFVCGAL